MLLVADPTSWMRPAGCLPDARRRCRPSSPPDAVGGPGSYPAGHERRRSRRGDRAGLSWPPALGWAGRCCHEDDGT